MRWVSRYEIWRYLCYSQVWRFKTCPETYTIFWAFDAEGSEFEPSFVNKNAVDLKDLVSTKKSWSLAAAAGGRRRSSAASGGRQQLQRLATAVGGHLRGSAPGVAAAVVPGLEAILEADEPMKWSWFYGDYMLFMKNLCKIYAICITFMHFICPICNKYAEYANNMLNMHKICKK